MGTRFTILKRCGLALVAVAVALTFTQTGRAQAPCLIVRGLDPLDVLNSGVRHNVWIVLDSSGSMNRDMNANRRVGNGGTSTLDSKMMIARDTLTEVIDEFVDASGRSLVNWGYVGFARNSVDNSTSCNAQFSNNCVGLALSELINPPACDQPDSAQSVKADLAGAVDGSGNGRGGSTPNGISMDQISGQIVANNYVANLLPNQKNFIILVTDGDDTCECRDSVWSPTAVPPFLGPSVTVPGQLRASIVNSGYNFTIPTDNTGRADRQAANAGSKGRLAYERLNPTPADRLTGDKGLAFVIGLGLSGNSPARANHLAWEASGAYYGNPNEEHALFANDKAGLKQALRDAFAKIGVPSSEVALGSPVVGTVREVIPNYTSPTLTADDHIGDVGPGSPDQEDIREARSVRGNHRDNVLFSSTVEIPEFKGHFRATSIYQVNDPVNARTDRSPDFREIWDAGVRLRDRTPDSRNLLFNRRGETQLREFKTGIVTAADLGVGTGFLSEIDGVGALNADDAAEMVVEVIRGHRLSRHSLTGTLYDPFGDINFSQFEADGTTPTWKLYDSLAAPAVMQNPPRSPDFDPPQNHATKYGVGGSIYGDGFYWDHFNRQTMVYVPSNGGVMHAFDAETGDEVFGYLPDDVLGLASGEVPRSRDTLAEFVQLVVAENNGIPNHQFFLSGAPTVGDAFLRGDNGGDDLWHTMLTFGRGRGGRFVTGLDVTDPQAPLLRFNVGNREGLNDGALDGLGETWSIPVMGNVLTDASRIDEDRVDQWVAFMGGGYGCANAFDEGQYLFAIRVEDGSVHYSDKVFSDSNAAIPVNALVAMPRLFNPHEEDTADYVDQITRVYIGDIQGRVWKLVTHDEDPANWTLGVFAELGLDQPITAPVSVVFNRQADEVYVMAGTGGDQRVDGTVVPFKFVGLIDTDAEGDNTLQYALGSAAKWEKTVAAEERVYIAPVVIGSFENNSDPVVFFASSRPTFDGVTCKTEFYSSLWGVTITDGLAFADLDGAGVSESVALGQGKVTGLYARGKNLYVSESGGLGSSGSLSVYGDGQFEDGLPGGTGGNFSIQVMVDGFRMSPF